MTDSIKDIEEELPRLQDESKADYDSKIASDVETRGIRVRAVARYMPEHSSPEQERYFFSYRIVISNEGSEPAQLLSRHWIIIDSDGKRNEVQGPGVVGHTPRLEPGEHFEYSSFCPLETDFGTMEGSYTMTTDEGEEFEARVARFYLAMNAPAPAED